MTAAVVILSVLLLIAMIGWIWAEMECRAQKNRAESFQHYSNWLETKYNLAASQLQHLGEASHEGDWSIHQSGL